MAKHACNSEGVKILNGMSTSLKNALEEIANANTAVRKVADENRNSLGPHVESFNNALSDIEAALKAASVPANEVANKLKSVADKYQDIIDDDPFA